MIDFAALMNFAFENRLYESEVHGIEHWHQVEYNGLLLAKKTGADIDVVRLFAIFHEGTTHQKRFGITRCSFSISFPHTSQIIFFIPYSFLIYISF